MSQGRAAELPVTTDTKVPLMPAAVVFHYLIINGCNIIIYLFLHSLISIIMIIMIKVPFAIATLLFIFISLSYHNYHDVSALYLTKVANSGPNLTQIHK